MEYHSQKRGDKGKERENTEQLRKAEGELSQSEGEEVYRKEEGKEQEARKDYREQNEQNNEQ